MNAQELSMTDIAVGATSSVMRTFTEDDVQQFARLSGDENPLHMDDEYAKTTQFGQRLVHGMLVGSLCSTLVGMHLPGKRCLYLDQSLSFKKPVFIGDTIVATASVLTKSEATKILTIAISMKKGEEIVIEGTAHVQVL